MTSSSLFVSRSTFLTALFAGGIFIACGSGASEPAAETADGGVVDTSSKIPEGSVPPSDRSPTGGASSTSKSDAGDAGTEDAGAKDASAASDASIDATTTKDAAADAGPQPAKLPYGSTCTTHGDCAGGICLEFDGKLRCTKTCKKDSDCQNGDDCDDDIKVCEID